MTTFFFKVLPRKNGHQAKHRPGRESSRGAVHLYLRMQAEGERACRERGAELGEASQLPGFPSPGASGFRPGPDVRTGTENIKILLLARAPTLVFCSHSRETWRVWGGVLCPGELGRSGGGWRPRGRDPAADVGTGTGQVNAGDAFPPLWETSGERGSQLDTRC